MHGNRACLGCYQRPQIVTTLDDRSKSVDDTISQTAKKPEISEDLWTTSTCDMDNSAVQSQGSISSISVANNVFDSISLPSSSTNAAEFINHGLLLWNQTRQSWIGNQTPRKKSYQLQEPKLNWNVNYDSLLGSNKPFPQRIPLPEMVDFLVDVWEQEGMYD